MKRFLTFMLVLIMMMSVAVSCGKDNGDDNQGDKNPTEHTQTESESEDEDTDMEIKPEKADLSEFYGTWTASSDKAEYMYGNVDITINEDGTWKGNITDEDLSGTWKKVDNYIVCSSKLFTFNVLKSTNGNIVMQETDDAVRVVLTKR